MSATQSETNDGIDRAEMDGRIRCDGNVVGTLQTKLQRLGSLNGRARTDLPTSHTLMRHLNERPRGDNSSGVRPTLHAPGALKKA